MPSPRRRRLRKKLRVAARASKATAPAAPVVEEAPKKVAPKKEAPKKEAPKKAKKAAKKDD